MQYSITFINQTKKSNHVCVFQKLPTTGTNLLSVAWFTKYVPAPIADRRDNTSSVELFWNMDYSFEFLERKTTDSGIIYTSTESIDADLEKKNEIDFIHDDINNAFRFENLRKEDHNGTLKISTDNTIIAGNATVGIGMSGSPVFVAPAEPNSDYTLTPHPDYWITFGNYTQGQEIDTGIFTHAKQLTFGGSKTSLVVTLTENNEWIVS